MVRGVTFPHQFDMGTIVKAAPIALMHALFVKLAGRITSGDDDSRSPVHDISGTAAEILPWTTGRGRLP
jgi:hypothetical protein